MCPSAPRVCSEPGGQKPELSLSLDLIHRGLHGDPYKYQWTESPLVSSEACCFSHNKPLPISTNAGILSNGSIAKKYTEIGFKIQNFALNKKGLSKCRLQNVCPFCRPQYFRWFFLKNDYFFIQLSNAWFSSTCTTKNLANGTESL